MKKIIRIQAKSDTFEIDEQVYEDKAEKRLKQIKGYMKNVSPSSLFGKTEPALKVTTSVINPTLP